MKSSYPSCRVGRADYVVIKTKPIYKRKAKEDRKGLKYTNKEILEVRWLYEFENWSVKDIQELSGMPKQYVYNILHYQVQPLLIPEKDDFISFK